MKTDSVRRREDDRMVRGLGCYADDTRVPGLLHGAFVRSPHAHARIRAIDPTEAASAPGVVAVLTAVEAEADGLASIASPVSFPKPDGSAAEGTPRPLLCGSVTRHVGEPVAFVVAETLAAAQDAAENVEVDYEPLPAVSRIPAALAADAPAVWEDIPGNVAVLWKVGDAAAVAAAFESAAHIVTAELDIGRITAAPMEPRSATGSVEDGRLTLRVSNQSPHTLRDQLAKLVFRVPASDLRVIARDVGGSFGMKSGVYREEAVVLWAAKRLGRPVRWTCSRSEAFLSDEDAREAVAHADLALDADGRFLAFRTRCDVNIGAYLTGRSLPLVRNIGGVAGVYRTPHIHAEIRGVLSHTAQTSAYRGAGRPEATYILERTIDIAAHRLGIDPFELRARNLVPPEAMPYKTGLVFTYDCGDFPAVMKRTAALIDLEGFAARRARSAAEGRLRGLGFANPIEVSGGPLPRPGKDMTRISVAADGNITLTCGVMSTGQGLETAMPQLAAQLLGISSDRIAYRQGDTDNLPLGRGSGGSSSLAVGGGAVSAAVDRLLEKARMLAAEELEASAADLEYEAGRFLIAGTDRAVTLADLARASGESEGRGRLTAEAEFQPPAVTFPNGCHACEVEVEPQTGKVTILRYAAVEDVGTVLNTMLVEGQMHGGIAQGFGQAVKERKVYDESGEVLTGTFTDYAMPLAADLPFFDLQSHEVPTAVNPNGAKGVGEAGTVGSLSAIANAICDAVAGLGIEHIDTPITPDRLWTAIEAVRQARPDQD